MIFSKNYQILVRFFSSKIPTNLKGKKKSSQEWLTRQLKDPYVEKSKQENYRCRSAYKLLELNQKHKLLSPGNIVIDIGCAPGSWSQVCVKAVNADGAKKNKPQGMVIGVDKLQMFPLDGMTFYANADFKSPETIKKILTALNGRRVNCVLSDMAPNASGIRSLDQENIMELANGVFDFARHVSAENASMVIKIWSNSEMNEFVEKVKGFYEICKFVKPEASRADSAEIYVLAKNFKGNK